MYKNPFDNISSPKSEQFFLQQLLERKSTFLSQHDYSLKLNFEKFEKLTITNTNNLLNNAIQENGLYLKLTTDTENQKASQIWNSSYVLDYLTRSNIFSEINKTELKFAIEELFKIEPLDEFFKYNQVEKLLAFPRSFPHLIQLFFFYHDYEFKSGEIILDYILKTYSKDNFLFYEAEYVSLQLLTTLLFLAKKEKLKNQTAKIYGYFDSILPVIVNIVERNDNYYCNEQFEKKYNILLFSFLTDLSIVYRQNGTHPVFREPHIISLKSRILERIFEHLTSCLKETEYLLYFTKSTSTYLSKSNKKCNSFIQDLWNELESRKKNGMGLTVTKDGGPCFNFHLCLNLYAYESLFFNI